MQQHRDRRSISQLENRLKNLPCGHTNVHATISIYKKVIQLKWIKGEEIFAGIGMEDLDTSSPQKHTKVLLVLMQISKYLTKP